MYLVAYQQFANFFFFVQLWQTKPISKLFEASTPALCKTWKALVPCVKRKSVHVWLPSHIHKRSWTSIAPSCLPHGWCKWTGVVYNCYCSIGRDLPKMLAWLPCLPHKFSTPKQCFLSHRTKHVPLMRQYFGALLSHCLRCLLQTVLHQNNEKRAFNSLLYLFCLFVHSKQTLHLVSDTIWSSPIALWTRLCKWLLSILKVPNVSHGSIGCSAGGNWNSWTVILVEQNSMQGYKRTLSMRKTVCSRCSFWFTSAWEWGYTCILVAL